MSSTVATSLTPAAWTSASIRPSSRTAAGSSDGRIRSIGAATAEVASHSASSDADGRAMANTSSPRSANIVTIAEPIPPVAPVTTTTRSLISEA